MPRRTAFASPRRLFRFAALTVFAAFLAAAAPASSAVTTTFNANTEGWLVTGDNASVWSATGGNPGGCFYVNDLATGDTNLAVAPPAFLGDWSAMTPADSLTIDFYFHNTSGGAVVAPAYTFRISGPGGAAISVPGYIPPQNVWSRVGTPIAAANWVVQSGTWSAILAHVTTVYVYAEFVSGDEEVRIDNARLTGNVTTIFTPCETETFTVAGLGDWSFTSTGGVTNPGSGGNGGGFCRVVDAAGTSLAFAPARFLGNWSTLNGTGALTIDLRLVSLTGPVVGSAQFIRLTGPGGVASVALTPAEIPVSTLVWKTLRYPLAAGSWTVSSGTWAGLLANVTECRIEAEVVSGTEVVGLDNFGRLSAGCGEPDDSVVVASGIQKCGYESLIGVSTVARNPADGDVYALIDAASGSGGGLYPLVGPTAGVRLQAYTTPAHLIFDATGAAFVSEDASGNIFRFAGGVSSTWVSGFHSGDDDPMGMCFAPAGYDGPNVDPGDVLVSDYGFSGPDEIWSFKTTVAEGELQVVPDVSGTPDFYDLAAGGGFVYTVSVGDPNNLYTISPTGVLATISLSTPLTSMVGLAYDPTIARLYVIENGGKTLRRIHPGTGAVELVASGFTLLGDCGIEVQPANGRVWVVDSGTDRVYSFCPTSSTGVEEVANGGPDAGGAVADGIVASISASPNPARNAGTVVSFSLRRAAHVNVTIHDLAGRVVRRLTEGAARAGRSETAWDGRDGEGRSVAAGIYLARIEADGEAKAARVTILR